jgi:hypothetical protein
MNAQAATEDMPPFAQREAAESAVEAIQQRIRRAGDSDPSAQGQVPEVNANFRTLIYMYRSLLRERKLWLMEDAQVYARIRQLFAYMCNTFPTFAQQCKPAVTLETLQVGMPLPCMSVCVVVYVCMYVGALAFFWVRFASERMLVRSCTFVNM